MEEVNQLKLKQLYVLRDVWGKGIRPSIQTQYIKEGLQLRNNDTGKDLLFLYSKIFDKIVSLVQKDTTSETCFIHYTKATPSMADNVRFKRKDIEGFNGPRYHIDGYPFEKRQICFLNDDMLTGKSFEKFAQLYIEALIYYEEADLEGEKVGDDLSFLDDLMDSRSTKKKKVYLEPSPKNLCQEIELPGAVRSDNNQKGNIMNKVTKIASTTVEINKQAITLAAKLEVGKIATAQLKKVVKPKLPMMVRGYADSPLFDIVLANAVGIALREYAPGNEKAQIVSEAMIQSAAVEMMTSFNINDMVNEMLENIDVSKLTNLESKEA